VQCSGAAAVQCSDNGAKQQHLSTQRAMSHLLNPLPMKFGKTLNRGFYYGNRHANSLTSTERLSPRYMPLNYLSPQPRLSLESRSVVESKDRFPHLQPSTRHLHACALSPNFCRRAASASSCKSASLCSPTASREHSQEARLQQKDKAEKLIKREKKALGGRKVEVK
jgi:hypothetical protein